MENQYINSLVLASKKQFNLCRKIYNESEIQRKFQIISASVTQFLKWSVYLLRKLSKGLIFANRDFGEVLLKRLTATTEHFNCSLDPVAFANTLILDF